MKRKAFSVVGLGFGDEGKGTIVDALTQRHNAHTVIRFNGSAQAAHNVVLPDGTHHTFSQFGAGTFHGARTHLTRDFLLNPYALYAESSELSNKNIKNPLSRVSIHEDAKIVTPYHSGLNRLRESSRSTTHGSCGMGVGETMLQHINHPDLTIFARDIRNLDILRTKLQRLEEYTRAQFDEIKATPMPDDIRKNFEYHLKKQSVAFTFPLQNICELITMIVKPEVDDANSAIIVDDEYEQWLHEQDGCIVLEGAQGVLLDEWYGFHPHTTWSTTTFENADRFLQGYDGEYTKIGVIRSYHTRHGEGPFPTECALMTQDLPDSENVYSPWQHGWRVGALDIPLLNYAVEIARPDVIAITCLDRITEVKVAVNYEHLAMPYHLTRIGDKEDLRCASLLTKELSSVKPIIDTIPVDDLPRFLQVALETEVAITSHGKTYLNKNFYEV